MEKRIIVGITEIEDFNRNCMTYMLLRLFENNGLIVDDSPLDSSMLMISPSKDKTFDETKNKIMELISEISELKIIHSNNIIIKSLKFVIEPIEIGAPDKEYGLPGQKVIFRDNHNKECVGTIVGILEDEVYSVDVGNHFNERVHQYKVVKFLP